MIYAHDDYARLPSAGHCIQGDYANGKSPQTHARAHAAAAWRQARYFRMATLQTSFDTLGCKLVIGIDRNQGSSLVVPVSTVSYERLYLVCGDQWHHVKSLYDLRHRVTIRSASQALQFVRLRTSTVLYWCFDGQLEVMSTASLTLSAEFGDRVEMQSLRQIGHGFAGVASPSQLARFGLREATVVSAGGWYTINRTLVSWPRLNRAQFYEVTERVGPDGEYSVVSRRALHLRDVPSWGPPGAL